MMHGCLYHWQVVARQKSPDSLRAQFGADAMHNAMYCSPSLAAAKRVRCEEENTLLFVFGLCAVGLLLLVCVCPCVFCSYNMCVCLCMCVCLRVCLHVCACVYVYVCVCVLCPARADNSSEVGA